MKNPKPKYHFEGKRKNGKGKEVWCISDLKTKELLEWDEKTYEKNKKYIEAE